jgi:hypothetical protein
LSICVLGGAQLCEQVYSNGGHIFYKPKYLEGEWRKWPNWELRCLYSSLDISAILSRKVTYAEHWGTEKCIENFYFENQNRRHYLEDIGMGKYILKKYSLRVCIGFFEFRVETNGGLLLTRQ